MAEKYIQVFTPGKKTLVEKDIPLKDGVLSLILVRMTGVRDIYQISLLTNK
jgi:hypothetical protein